MEPGEHSQTKGKNKRNDGGLKWWRQSIGCRKILADFHQSKVI